jgi:hypothetical protein
MRGKKKNERLSLAVGLILAALTLGLKASANQEWLPNVSSQRAVERGETCSVLRQLASDHGRLALENQTVLASQLERLKTHRKSLLACAKDKGIPLNLGDLSESSMAEFCGPQFAVWIHQGYQLEMIRQDLTQVTKDLQWVTTRLLSSCPGPRPGPVPARSPSRSPGGAAVEARRRGEEANRLSKSKAPETGRRRKPELQIAWLRGHQLPQ